MVRRAPPPGARPPNGALAFRLTGVMGEASVCPSSPSPRGAWFGTPAQVLSSLATPCTSSLPCEGPCAPCFWETPKRGCCTLPAGGPTALASAWCPLVLFLVMDRNVLEQWAWEPVRQRRPEVPEGASLRFTDVMHPRVEPTSECSSSVKRPAGGPGGPPAEARGPGSV